jgi:hypothetical protein
MSLKMAELTRMGDTFDMAEDQIGLARACAEYAESVKMLRSVGATNTTSFVSTLTGGVYAGDEDESGEDVAVYIVPTAAMLEQNKRNIKKAAEKDKIGVLLGDSVLKELYERDPVISKKVHAHGHRDFVTIQLRRAFTCYYACCEGKKEVMEERYKGHKFNISNFKKGCVCNGDWGLWKI